MRMARLNIRLLEPFDFLRAFAAAAKRSRSSLPLPGMVSWRARPKASASSGTSSVMTLPDAT